MTCDGLLRADVQESVSWRMMEAPTVILCGISAASIENNDPVRFLFAD
jgi:hypothetical protein